MPSPSDYWSHHYETIFCIFLAVLAYLWRENSQIVYPQILYLVTLLLGLNLLAGTVLKQWPAREWIPALLICANNAVITAIVAYSGGRESNLWVIYLLPIYTACLLLRGREVAWITAGAITFNAMYSLFSVIVWDAVAYGELLLKSGIFVFSAAITYQVGQRDRHARDALHEQSIKLEQSQKMEAIGRLAGGIAHDFNNLLTAILGSTHFLLESISEKDSKFPDVREIRSAATRAAALTQQLLAFSRRQALKPRILDLNAVIRDMEKILRRVVQENISFKIVLDQKLKPVKIDPGQFEQVIMNLAVNARDAMPEGGVIKIQTTNHILAKSRVYFNFSVPQGPYVVLSVGDSGTGMDANTLKRIFEPFFTTKELGRGTGLGLSTVYGIVKQSGGYILVSSDLGKGTTFQIYLPQAQGPIDPDAKGRVVIPLVEGSETILLAEDEAPVRSLSRRILTQHGYKVLDMENGEHALRIAEQYQGPVHLLVTDMVMPGFSGPELFRRLQLARPKTKVIFISGYSDREMLGATVLNKNLPFLPKPFTPEALLRKVRDILDSDDEPLAISAPAAVEDADGIADLGIPPFP